MRTSIRARAGLPWKRGRRGLLASLCLAGAVSLSAGGAASAASAHPAASGIGPLTATQVSTIKAALAAARKPSRWTAGGPAFSAKSLKGKTVWLLNDATNQWADNFAAGVKSAVLAAGLNYAEGTGGPGGTNDAQAVENAVNEHVDAIIEIANPSLVSSALLKAKAAGIPVILAFDGDAHQPTATEKGLGIRAIADYCYSCTGYLAAEYEILHDNGKVVSQVEQFPGNTSSDTIAKGWVAALKKFCPKTCSTSYVNLNLAGAFIQSVQSGAQVAAQGGSINVLFPVYDFLMGFMLPELTAANAQGRIAMASENADLAQMQELKAGVSVNANVGNPVAWDGWSAVDQTLRVLKHLPSVANENVPVRMFDSSNIGSVNLSENPANWYGTATYGLDYERLWGLR